MDLLVSDEHASGGGGKDVSVISIVGMGGLGKTTLTQLVYNHENVQKHYQVRAWVCVSDRFDISRITREIIESATRGSCGSSSIDSLQRELEQILTAKRFLIVLDDVWNTERSAWDGLRPPFSYGEKGSKIIVTTRDVAVSRTMDTDHFYPLGLLSDDDCLSLFLQHAFLGENCNAHSELKEIGKDLVERRCQGLPLAAKALGGLLSSKSDINFWRSILNSDLWISNEGESEVMKVLKVSYHHFPQHIKQCFAFFSVFPKDYEFFYHDVVNLWMAQGFIQFIETGREYINFLLSRSFFQSTAYKLKYKMHDCIHDLAMLVSSGECFRFDGKPTCIPARGHRHLFFNVVDDEGTVNWKDLDICKGSCTIIIYDYSNLNKQILSGLFVNLRCLRALVLTFSKITELPDSISSLKHLRYLDLSLTKIRQLPESVSSLYNLQTIFLRWCSQLCQLPKETRKLVNLRQLDLVHCLSLKSMPPEIGRLTCLQTLCTFIVGREKGYGIQELKGLTTLNGLIIIKKLHNVSNAKEAEEANLKDKLHIKEFIFEWHDDKEDAANTNLRQDRVSLEELGKILEALQPHTNIKCLTIKGYGGKNYPSWLQDMMLPDLEKFSILQCTNCNSIPPLGQFRKLNELHIEGIPGVKCIGREFYGDGETKGFPSLEKLKISNMPNLEEWCKPEEVEFPSLQLLHISCCPKLTKMPNTLSTLKRLTLTASLLNSPSPDHLCLEECNEIWLKWVSHLTSLSTLKIEDFEELKSLPEDVLQPLDKLDDLQIIRSGKLVSLLKEDKGLPPFLTSLRISNCPSIKSLPKGLQSLTILEDLYIINCPQLLSLPEEGLPTSLQNLSIIGCPKLSERCREGDGEDWAKISHIPDRKIY